MGMNKTPIRITLTAEEREELQRAARGLVVSHREVVRARIVLMLAEGASVSAVASRHCVQRRIVRKWAERFTRKRLRGLDDAPRSGRPARFSPHGGDPLGEAGMRAS